ncbi:unnamed protein product [Camellia sinensis]
MLPCELRGVSSMVVEDGRVESESLKSVKRVSKDQKELDLCAEEFDVGRLSRLMGPEASNYTGELEDLYKKMLAKVDGLARLVEKSSARVLEQRKSQYEVEMQSCRLGIVGCYFFVYFWLCKVLSVHEPFSQTYSLCHALVYTYVESVERAASIATGVTLAAVLHLETAVCMNLCMNLFSETYSLCHALVYTYVESVERAASVAAAVTLAAVLHLETAADGFI